MKHVVREKAATTHKEAKQARGSLPSLSVKVPSTPQVSLLSSDWGPTVKPALSLSGCGGVSSLWIPQEICQQCIEDFKASAAFKEEVIDVVALAYI